MVDIDRVLKMMRVVGFGGALVAWFCASDHTVLAFVIMALAAPAAEVLDGR